MKKVLFKFKLCNTFLGRKKIRFSYELHPHDHDAPLVDARVHRARISLSSDRNVFGCIKTCSEAKAVGMAAGYCRAKAGVFVRSDLYTNG